MKTMKEFEGQVSKTLSNWELPKGKGKDSVREEILSAIRTKQGKVISLKKWHWVAAACVSVILLSYAVFEFNQVEHFTLNNQQQTIVLPDGSTAHINSDSKLNYNKLFWYINRDVKFSGEGFFKVTKGSQFNVNTTNGVISVLGTSFNVYSRKANMHVECYEGKVGVSNKEASTLLTPGEKANLTTSRTLAKSNIKKEAHEPGWLSGKFSFEKATLGEVIEEIERQFDVSIHSDDSINKLVFTGEWDKSMGLENVLDVVCLPFGLDANKTEYESYSISYKAL